MSDDLWGDVDTGCKIVMTAPPGATDVGEYRVDAVLRNDQQDNWVSTSFLLQMYKSQQHFGEVDALEELQWRPARKWPLRFTTSAFRVRDDIDVDIVLGERACQEVEEYNTDKLDSWVLTSFTNTSKAEKKRQEDKKPEKDKKSDDQKKAQTKKVHERFGFKDADQDQPPASSQAN